MSRISNNLNSGTSKFGILECDAIFIGNKRLVDFVNELQGEITFNQNQITEINAFLERLDLQITSPNILTLTNDNRNAVLKTAIDNLITRLVYLDTTGLTSSWVLNDTNRNSVLKSAIDSINSTIGTLNTKTQYITSAQGDNSTNPKTKSTHLIEVQDRHENRIILNTGGLNFLAINSFLDPTQNTSILSNVSGKVELTGQNIKLTPYQSSHNIDIGLFGISNTGNINIGGSLAKINIGSVETPIVGTSVGDVGFNDNTIINIGKRTITKNTTTNLQGNIYTGDARWESLDKSSALTWTQLLSLVSTTGIPAWVASFALSSGTPNFSHSDFLTMKAVTESGNLIKSGEIETTNNTKIKNLTVYDTSVVGVDIVPKEGTFIAKGHISKTTLLGDIKCQTFNGEITLRANNISPSNINWALTEAMDSVNALKLSNNDVELIAGAGANGSQLRISNTTTGPIKFRMGNSKLQANAHDAMNIYNTQATSQIQIGNNDTLANRYDTTSKVIIDHTQLNDGLKVCKATGGTTRVNHDSVNTGGVILQDGYTGTTNKALYTIENGAKLMYYGDQVYPPVTQLQAGTAGITYLIDNPTNLTNSATTPSITMSGTYTSATGTFITKSGYTVGLSYQLATIKSDYIPSASNPILDGVYEANLWANYQGNSPAKLYSKLYMTAETSSFTGTSLITKGYSGTGTGAVQAIKTLQIPVSQVSTGFFIPVVGYVDFNVGIIVFPAIQVVSSGTVTLTCTMIDNSGNILFTFPTLSASSGTSDRTFSGMNGATPASVNAVDLQFYQFQVAITNGTGTISQASARGVGDANYQITLKVKMMIYDGISNQTSLNYNTTELYALTLPLKSVDITQYTIFSKLEYESYFIQNSGSASNHLISLLFRDGNLSHIHTTINPTSSAVSTPTLASVLTSGNSSGANGINMNNNTITGLAGLVGDNGVSWTVKGVQAGTNVSISSNLGIFTINANMTEQAPFYSTTVNIVSNTLSVITLPSSVNLNNYDIDMRINCVLKNDGNLNTYTFFNIRYNSLYAGKMTWANRIHNGYDFSAIPDNGYNNPTSGQGGGTYQQCYTNPYFCYVPSYNSATRYQFFTTDFKISNNKAPITDLEVITTRFRTTVGQVLGSYLDTDAYTGRFQDQEGVIQTATTGGTNFPSITTITIGQAGGSGRNNYLNSPAEVVIWLNKK
jgi:hypothetical protein